MNIIVNGEEFKFSSTPTVDDIIQKYAADKQIVVAELNHEIIPRGKFKTTFCTDGDILELIRFVGGG